MSVAVRPHYTKSRIGRLKCGTRAIRVAERHIRFGIGVGPMSQSKNGGRLCDGLLSRLQR